MRALISQRVAISQSRRRVRRLPVSRFLREPARKGNRANTLGGPELSPRDYANESTQRGSTDSRLRCCQAETANQRHFLLPRRHTNNNTAFRSPTVLHTTYVRTRGGGRGRGGGEGGLAERGWRRKEANAASKHNRTED